MDSEDFFAESMIAKPAWCKTPCTSPNYFYYFLQSPLGLVLYFFCYVSFHELVYPKLHRPSTSTSIQPSSKYLALCLLETMCQLIIITHQSRSLYGTLVTVARTAENFGTNRDCFLADCLGLTERFLKTRRQRMEVLTR
jgi:hypothetical protein